MVKVESTFTLQYPGARTTEENARILLTKNDAIPSGKSEWSLRVYADEAGKNTWDPEVVHAMDKIFRRLAEEFLTRELLIPAVEDCGE